MLPTRSRCESEELTSCLFTTTFLLRHGSCWLESGYKNTSGLQRRPPDCPQPPLHHFHQNFQSVSTHCGTDKQCVCLLELVVVHWHNGLVAIATFARIDTASHSTYVDLQIVTWMFWWHSCFRRSSAHYKRLERTSLFVPAKMRSTICSISSWFSSC